MALTILIVIPVAKAILAGGTLVAHAGGGMIVTGASGYVVGTFLSTAAINSILAVGTTFTVGSAAVGVSALGGIPKVLVAVSRVKGVASTLLGFNGVVASTVVASEATGVLVSAGAVSATPVIVPIALSATAIGLGYVIFRGFKKLKKIKSKKVNRIYTEEVEEVLVAINAMTGLVPKSHLQNYPTTSGVR